MMVPSPLLWWQAAASDPKVAENPGGSHHKPGVNPQLQLQAVISIIRLKTYQECSGFKTLDLDTIDPVALHSFTVF